MFLLPRKLHKMGLNWVFTICPSKMFERQIHFTAAISSASSIVWMGSRLVFLVGYWQILFYKHFSCYRCLSILPFNHAPKSFPRTKFSFLNTLLWEQFSPDAVCNDSLSQNSVTKHFHIITTVLYLAVVSITKNDIPNFYPLCCLLSDVIMECYGLYTSQIVVI